MIVPYIVGSNDRATELTRAIGDQLELLELPQSAPLVVPLGQGEPQALPPPTSIN
jgi:hypothetical protein